MTASLRAVKSLMMVLVISLLSSHTYQQIKFPECIAVIEDNYENCTSDARDFISRGKKLKTICEDLVQESAPITNGSTDGCGKEPTCKKIHKLGLFHYQLFATHMKEAFLQMLDSCCGSCGRCSVHKEFEHLTDIQPPSPHSPDIIFPILAHTNAAKLYGYYFVPTFEVPSSYYFTARKTNRELVTRVINVCTETWPLIVIFLLMALICGFILWLFERRKNEEEFPRSMAGILEGFWCAFITMATVGYGDKAPRSYLGRAFSVITILTGIGVTSTLSAALTTEIINFRSLQNTDMNGKKVGVLEHRLHDALIVSQHGGIVHTMKVLKTVPAIFSLMKKVENKTLNGFLLNRETFYHFSGRIKAEKYSSLKTSVRNVDILRTETFLKGEKLSCGILLKNLTDFNFFSRYFEYNRLQLEGCNTVKMNFKKTEQENVELNLFSPDSGLFGSFLSMCLLILACLMFYIFALDVRKLYSEGMVKMLWKWAHLLRLGVTPIRLPFAFRSKDAEASKADS